MRARVVPRDLRQRPVHDAQRAHRATPGVRVHVLLHDGQLQRPHRAGERQLVQVLEEVI